MDCTDPHNRRFNVYTQAPTVMARQHPDVGLVAQHPMPRREHAVRQTGLADRGGFITCCSSSHCGLADVRPCVVNADEEEHEGGGGLEERRQREGGGDCAY